MADEIEETQTDYTLSKEDEELLEIARKRFDIAIEAEREFREEAIDDLKFYVGEQWPDDIKNQRSLEARPCLTINRLPQFVRQITNDQRQNRPSIKVSPVDDKGDIETAEIIQGMIRHIEYISNADVAYDTGFDFAAKVGKGHLRVVTDYTDPNSFEQDILIKRVSNSFAVVLDPHSKEPDGSDAEWGFYFEDISRDSFKTQYPKFAPSNKDEWDHMAHAAPDWIKEDSVRVAEYFYKEYKEVSLALLADGTVVNKDEIPADTVVQIVAERQSMVPELKWCLINGCQVLERRVWASNRWVPIVPVYGDETNIDGKRMYSGIIRNAKDPQRMFNYWASAETEAIALAPKAPFVIAEGQMEGHEELWETANQKNHAALVYKPTTIGAIPVPPPQRNSYEPAVMAISQARAQSADDLKATTGIYDAALGARSNEQSGIAIQRRANQAQTANFHYVDNLSRSMRHLGRILIDLIPKIYDTARVVRIIGEDGEQELVAVNQPTQRNGKEVIYDLTAGKYDVTVSTGPSYATKRQEAAQAMIEFTKALPQQASVISDLMAKNMDWPGSQEIAERLKRTIPPEIIGDENKEQQPIPPQVQAEMAQRDQMIEQLTAQLNEATGKIDNKTLELESKERIELKKLEVQLEIELAKLHSAEGTTIFQAEIESINQRLNMLNFNEPIDSENSFENENDAGPGRAMAPEVIDEPSGVPTPEEPMEY